MNITDYIKLPLAERQSHLQLDMHCEERGGCSKDFRIALARLVDTNLPMNGLGRKIHLAHACDNAKCCNPYHLYWATPVENAADRRAAGKYNGNAYRGLLKKFGSEAALKKFYSQIGRHRKIKMGA